MASLWIHCDNFTTCNESTFIKDSTKETDDYARAKGWHIWRGTTMGGSYVEVKLGPQCVGQRRRPDRGLPPLMPGDQTMIQIEVEADDTTQ